MKKNIAIVLAFIALAFIACEQNTPYEPGPQATTKQVVFFPVTEVLGVELDPEAGITSTEVTIGRTITEAAQAFKLNVTANTDKAFIIPDSVKFAAGEAQTKFTVKFDTTMQVGNTYHFGIEVDLSAINPYAAATEEKTGKALYPTFDYEATLIKYFDGEGVWVDDAVISAIYAVDPNVAWTADFQYAELPSGNIKVRILSPYNNLATSVDDNGVFDACPWNAPADLPEPDAAKNVVLIIDPQGNVTLESQLQFLGPDYGKGEFFIYDYNGAVGAFDSKKQVIFFDAADQTLAVGRYPSVNTYAGFRFYLTYDAYVADNAPEEEVAAPAKEAKRAAKAKVERHMVQTLDQVVR